MNFLKREKKNIFWLLAMFLVIYFLPVGKAQFNAALLNAVGLLNDYFRHHMLGGLLPAMFIAGAVSVFLKSSAVIKLLGAGAKKVVAYSVASVSGLLLAVCSCSVMPLFAGVYKMGAGLGPATTFLYAGPAINIMAITMTASVLGLKMGIARTVCAIMFSYIIGLTMAALFKKDEAAKVVPPPVCAGEEYSKPALANILFFVSLAGLLVFINAAKILAVILFAVILLFLLIKYFKKAEMSAWMEATFNVAKEMLPLLVVGILVSGFLLGTNGKEGMIPYEFTNAVLGGNGILANIAASFFGALIYFCTLIEVPIVQGLMNGGMGKGPALALLLAGPALSLPNMLIIKSVLGTKKTAVYILLVVGLSTITGYIFGNYF